MCPEKADQIRTLEWMQPIIAAINLDTEARFKDPIPAALPIPGA